MTGKNSCAIYTRKSSEDGLEQSFNSLDAQREACIAYIQSQKHEGWTALGERYDDGGFSGGTMDRPGLTKLLDDVQAGKVTTVVVYKVDRLTRSLSDFAKIIEIFDNHKVSFVSVTQQFNTTTSVGRLTLNVLLSFAQFERELTGERIRDKVAASKKKGMWMGGVVPLGYDCVDHRLVINQIESETVRTIFRSYLRLGCVSKLKNYLETEGIRSKIRTSSSGRKSGGVGYSCGALYHLLNNRVCIGQIVHRGEAYPGRHEAIISQGMWDEASTLLQANNQAHRKPKSGSTPSLLTGILRDVKGVRFTPTHTLKSGKRYRYYTSQAVIQGKSDVPAITRIPAPELESLVISQTRHMLESLEQYLTGDTDLEREEILGRAKDLASQWSRDKSSIQHAFVRNVLNSVIIGRISVCIRVDETKLIDGLLGRAQPHLRSIAATQGTGLSH
jgi:site-specific DNA recombinase